jgi:hypothetical protein
MANTPTPPSDMGRAARRARLLANLNVAVGLAEQLQDHVAKAFPLAAAEVQAALDPNLSVAERVEHGDAAVCALTAIAMELAPEQTLDALEANLTHDLKAEREAGLLMSRLKTAPNNSP